MELFAPHNLVQLLKELRSSALLFHPDNAIEVRRIAPVRVKELLERLESFCRSLLMLGTANYIHYTLIPIFEKAELLSPNVLTDETVGQTMMMLSVTIEGELRTRLFFSLSAKEQDRFEQPLKDWESIIAKFPDATDDIGEMNRCVAMTRYTAAVFHSLLVVEHGLVALGTYIGVTDPKLGWDATYKRLCVLVNDRKAIPAVITFNFVEQVKTRLDGMKMAWRNKVNHAAGRLLIEKTGFSDVYAEEVIVACRSFMRFLAEELPGSSTSLAERKEEPTTNEPLAKYVLEAVEATGSFYEALRSALAAPAQTPCPEPPLVLDLRCK